MRNTFKAVRFFVAALAPLGVFAQAPQPAPIVGPSAPGYIPGVSYQKTNSSYPQRNPFYFEGRIDWNLLNITQPSNAWDYMQRGIHEQDDLEDNANAIKDYEQSIALNNLSNKTCQLVTTPTPSTGQLDPPPCMFTVRLRLAGLLREEDPERAIELYNEALAIDPLRLGVHAAIAEVFVSMAEHTTDAAKEESLYEEAIAEFEAELALSPVTPLQTQLTGDEANNAHVHWELAEIYEKLDQPANESHELDLYLKATKWHSDTYPWRIKLAEKRLEKAETAAKATKTTPSNK
jgi:tetratricopeptide (TPR) repeat protein